MPKPLGGATLSRDGEDWMFSSPALAKGGYRLFPEQEGWFDAAAQQTVSRDGDGVSLRIPAAGATTGSAFRGLLSNGTNSHSSITRPVARPPAGAPQTAQNRTSHE